MACTHFLRSRTRVQRFITKRSFTEKRWESRVSFLDVSKFNATKVYLPLKYTCYMKTVNYGMKYSCSDVNSTFRYWYLFPRNFHKTHPYQKEASINHHIKFPCFCSCFWKSFDLFNKNESLSHKTFVMNTIWLYKTKKSYMWMWLEITYLCNFSSG